MIAYGYAKGSESLLRLERCLLLLPSCQGARFCSMLRGRVESAATVRCPLDFAEAGSLSADRRIAVLEEADFPEMRGGEWGHADWRPLSRLYLLLGEGDALCLLSLVARFERAMAENGSAEELGAHYRDWKEGWSEEEADLDVEFI